VGGRGSETHNSGKGTEKYSCFEGSHVMPVRHSGRAMFEER
jgi:hypothetical protein